MFKKWFYNKKDKSGSAASAKDAANFQKKKLQLPKGFAKQVIELEIQCERLDATKDHVNLLMDLYTVSHSIVILLQTAIEYYNFQTDVENQQFFQMKLQNLLNRHDIQTVAGIEDNQSNLQKLMDYNSGKHGKLTRTMSMQEKRVSILLYKTIKDKQIQRNRLEDTLKLQAYNHEKQN